MQDSEEGLERGDVEKPMFFRKLSSCRTLFPRQTVLIDVLPISEV
jgi:hypothetical protein